MKTLRTLASAMAAGLLLATAAPAQEKPKPPAENKPTTALRVQVVLSEYDGEKKISSHPYTLLVNADESHPGRPAMVRMGLRVPVDIRGKDSQFQYMDVGTNLDCSAERTDAGRYMLILGVERSSIYSAGPENRIRELEGQVAPSAGQPIVRQFRTTLILLERDGETIQAMAAADPLSGHMLKLEVTVNVLK